MQPLSVGIIGFGRIGAEHAAWLAQATNIRATAVADATPARQTLARQQKLRIYSTIDELLNDKTIDAILVATPTAMHFDHTMAALAAGKHVLVEKPMALDLAQSKKMVEEAVRRNLVLSVFQNRRWDLDFLTVQSAIQSGVFGKLINIESRLGQWSSCVGPAAREYRPNWRNEASFGGGGLYDWGSHFVDQIWRLLWPSKPLRVFAQLRGNVWTQDCDDFARLAIDFDCGAGVPPASSNSNPKYTVGSSPASLNAGVTALVEINTTTTRPLPRWHLDGTTGSADSPHSPAFDLNKWAELDFTPADGSSARRLPIATTALSETQIWEQFAAAITHQSSPAVNVRSVLCTMALLDAARQSSREGRAIDVTKTVDWIY